MKKTFKILGIILGVVVCSVVVVIGLGALWLATATNVPVTDDDKRTIVRSIDLVPYFDEYSPVEEFESFEKIRYVDQSEELSYEYDSPKEDEPYIAVTVTHDRNRSDANLTYSIEWSAQRLGLNIAGGDIGFEENSSFYSGGDRSRFADFTYDGESIGHLFVAQKGKSVYAFTITGFVMDDPTMWRELFDDRIAKLEGD
jgi:hypothetical protein